MVVTSLPIRGVIFDLDGVLTDTSEFHTRAGSNWLMKKAFLSTEANEQLRGWSRRIR